MLYLRAVPNKIVSLSRKSQGTFSNPTLGLEIQTFFAFFLGYSSHDGSLELRLLRKKVKAESIEKVSNVWTYFYVGRQEDFSKNIFYISFPLKLVISTTT